MTHVISPFVYPVPVSDNGGSLTVDGTINPSTAHGKTITYVSVAQGAAGSTQLAAADASYSHKVIGCILVLDAAGSIKFKDSSGDLTGAMHFQGLQSLPYQFPGHHENDTGA